MIDVGKKRYSHRTALASGLINLPEAAFNAFLSNTLPKGDPLQVAKIAAIFSAKETSRTIPMCHPIEINKIDVFFETDLKNRNIIAYCIVRSFGKTGVEMEALQGVSTALLTIYDMVKPITSELTISDIKLLLKLGGKSNVYLNNNGLSNFVYDNIIQQNEIDSHKLPSFNGINFAVLVMSDNVISGKYEDLSGHKLQDSITELNGRITEYKVISNEINDIENTVNQLANQGNIDIVFCSGGTGIGPRDNTISILRKASSKEIIGIGELLRSSGSNNTKNSWLSRSSAFIINKTIFFAFPGSVSGTIDGFNTVLPLISHVIKMLHGAGH